MALNDRVLKPAYERRSEEVYTFIEGENEVVCQLAPNTIPLVASSTMWLPRVFIVDKYKELVILAQLIADSTGTPADFKMQVQNVDPFLLNQEQSSIGVVGIALPGTAVTGAAKGTLAQDVPSIQVTTPGTTKGIICGLSYKATAFGNHVRIGLSCGATSWTDSTVTRFVVTLQGK